MASVVIELSADEAKLWRALKKVQAQNEEVDGSLKKVKKSGIDAFGDRAVGQLKSFVTGMVSIQTAISFATAQWQEYKQEKDKALSTFVEMGPSESRLAQVAVSAEDLRNLEDYSDFLARTYGIERERARELMTSARGERFEGAAPLIAEAAVALEGGELQSFSRVAGQVRTLFGEQIDSIEALNAAMAAAIPSNLTYGQLADVLPIATEGLTARVNPEQTIAALSVFSSEFARPSTAADRLKAFTSKTGQAEEFAGLDILQSFEKLRDMPKEARKEFLKDSMEINAAYNALEKNYELIRERQQEVKQGILDAGTAQAPLRRQIEIARSQHKERIDLAAAEQFFEAENEKTDGKRAAELRAARLKGLAELKRAGVGGARYQTARVLSAGIEVMEKYIWDRGLTPEEMRQRTIRNADVMFERDIGKAARQVEAANAEAARKMEAAADKILRASTNLEAKAAAPPPSPSRAPVAQRELNAVPAE